MCSGTFTYKLDSALSRTSVSLAQRCPGQPSAWFSTVPDRCKLGSALSRTDVKAWVSVVPDRCTSLARRCPGKCSAWLRLLSPIFLNLLSVNMHFLSCSLQCLIKNWTTCTCTSTSLLRYCTGTVFYYRNISSLYHLRYILFWISCIILNVSQCVSNIYTIQY